MPARYGHNRYVLSLAFVVSHRTKQAERYAAQFLVFGGKITFWDIYGPDKLTPDLLDTLLKTKEGKGKGKASGLVWDVDPEKLLLLDLESSDEDDANRRKATSSGNAGGKGENKKAWDRGRGFQGGFLDNVLMPAHARGMDAGREELVKIRASIRADAPRLAEMSSEEQREYMSAIAGDLISGLAAKAAEKKMKKKK